MGCNKDNSDNSNDGGTCNNQSTRAVEETTMAATVTGSCYNCDNGNKGGGDNGEKVG